MNYQHGFHAGNHGDVLKHIVLVELLRLMTVKPAALAYLDSHAGAGRYSLDSEQAGRTGEWQAGIGRLPGYAAQAGADAPQAGENTAVPEVVARYLAAVRAANTGSHGRTYPGSPALAAALLRDQDRLRLCELQPDVARTLERSLAARDRRVQVFQADGYQHALKALLPPPERRGLVLVDPPYESREEYARIIVALEAALARFATGVYAVWYPIKQASGVAPLLRKMAALPVQSALVVEVWPRACDSPLRMNGSGMAILNPPWGFARDAGTWLDWLAQRLASGRGAGSRLHWLKRERS